MSAHYKQQITSYSDVMHVIIHCTTTRAYYIVVYPRYIVHSRRTSIRLTSQMLHNFRAESSTSGRFVKRHHHCHFNVRALSCRLLDAAETTDYPRLVGRGGSHDATIARRMFNSPALHVEVGAGKQQNSNQQAAHDDERYGEWRQMTAWRYERVSWHLKVGTCVCKRRHRCCSGVLLAALTTPRQPGDVDALKWRHHSWTIGAGDLFLPCSVVTSSGSQLWPMSDGQHIRHTRANQAAKCTDLLPGRLM